MDLPSIDGGFRTILADPPWTFKARTALQVANWNSRRDAEKHYTVMNLEAIKALPVKNVAAKDAHLFLWTTGPCLPQAFEVITAWGFRYSSVAFTWAKLKRSYQPDKISTPIDTNFHCGLGLTTRKNAEFCLLARRGNARREAKDVREIIVTPVREHSRKPDETYERIQRYCVGPYLELFARQSRSGWAVWGNEVDKFDPPVASVGHDKDIAPRILDPTLLEAYIAAQTIQSKPPIATP